MADVVTRRVRTAGVFASIAALLPAVLVFFGFEREPAAFVPVAVAALPLVVPAGPALRAAALAAAVLQAVYVVLVSMSVGALYVPSFVELAVAAHAARGGARA